MEEKISFRRILKTYLSKHFQFQEIWSQINENEPKVSVQTTSKRYHFLWILKGVSWLCLIFFVLSFWVDFSSQHRMTIFGREISFENLIRILSVSGLIGFGTNWLAIKMLFRPQKRRPIWGQGLIPAQKAKISDKLAFAIHHNVLNETHIKQILHESQLIPKISNKVMVGIDNLLRDQEFLDEIQRKLEQSLKHYFEKEENRKKFADQLDSKLNKLFRGGFKGFVFKTYTKLQPNQYKEAIDGAIKEIPSTVKDLISNSESEILELNQLIKSEIPEAEKFISDLISEVLEQVNLHEMFRKQIHQFDEGKLEDMIWGATNEQLRYIQDLGGLLGIIGGLIIWQPILSGSAILILLGTLAVLDNVLYKNS